MPETETVHYDRTGDALQDGLNHLEHLVTEAEVKRLDARHAADAAVSGAILLPEVVALREHCDAVLYRVPGANADPNEERRLAGALCSAVSQNADLRLVPLGGSRFRVDDAGPYRKLAEADAPRGKLPKRSWNSRQSTRSRLPQPRSRPKLMKCSVP